MSLTYKIEGLDEALKKLSPEQLSTPLFEFMRDAASAVEEAKKERSPVDTGRLRSSIQREIDEARPPAFAQVGTNVEYGATLDAGPYHYRAGTFEGQPTAGWFTGYVEDWRPKFDEYLERLKEKLAALWRQ